MNKEQAQSYADRICAFREELASLIDNGVTHIPEEELNRIREHHDDILHDFTERFDVDTTGAQKQMSWGMRLVSFFGALALSAAVFFFFYRIWGYLSATMQILILVAAPLLLTLATWTAARREKTGYFAHIFGMVALACFILNISVLGKIFSITSSQNAFLVWGVFALILAYSLELHLLLVAGILCLMGYLSATAGTWGGFYWISFGDRPENFILAGIAMFAVPFIFSHRAYPLFPRFYRLMGMLSVLIATLILANWGYISYLLIDPRYVEYIYQVLGFGISGALVWLGIRRGWSGMTNLGATFFVIFLYTKFFDWFWDWFPKYLFFLLIGMAAILILLVLRRFRKGAGEAAS